MVNVFSKRIVAYIVDILIVAIVSGIITMAIPVSKEYNKAYEGYSEAVEKVLENRDNASEYKEVLNNYSYDMNKESIPVSIVTLFISIIYFVVGNYFWNGQTFGKKLMKIKIASNNRKKLTMNNYLIRALIINSALMNIINIVLLMFLKKSVYLSVNNVLTYFFGAIYIVAFGMMSFRTDGRGLHDIIANTKVISTKTKEKDIEEEVEVKNEDTKLKDAEIIKERKVKERKV